MKIRAVDTQSKRDRKKFIQFPFDLYKNSKYWVPPFVSEMDFSLDKKRNPFFKQGDAEFLIAENGNEVIGRLTIINNHVYNKHNNLKEAFFYHFECVDDENASNALFDAAKKWTKQQGLNSIMGPHGMLGGDGLGTLVEGFDHLPAIGIAYNKPYYDGLIEKAGFKKLVDYHSGFLATKDYDLPERIHKLADRVKERRGFYIKMYETKAAIKEDVLLIRDVFNSAFEGSPGYSPIQDDELEAIVDRLLMIADPRLIKLVFKQGQIVGFLFAYPNISEGIQKARGRLFPFGWIHILLAKRNTKLLDINGIGILPEHQGVGANSILYSEMDKTVRDYNFEFADIVQISEKNMKSMAEMKALGIQWYKRHRVYEMGL